MGFGVKILTGCKTGSRFSYENRSPIFISNSIRDFCFSTAIRFSDQNRDHDCDQKLFWKKRSAISGSKPGYDF